MFAKHFNLIYTRDTRLRFYLCVQCASIVLQTHVLLMDAFVQNNRLDHVSRVMSSHPSYLEHFLRTQHFILRGDGPLPYDYRHLIAIMVSPHFGLLWKVSQVLRRTFRIKRENFFLFSRALIDFFGDVILKMFLVFFFLEKCSFQVFSFARSLITFGRSQVGFVNRRNIKFADK